MFLRSPAVAIFIYRVLSCLFDSPTVPPNAALVKRVAKTAAGGLPIKRRTMNAQESQIDDGEIVRKIQVMAARHRRRCELAAAFLQRKKKLTSLLHHFQFFSKTAFGEANAGWASAGLVSPPPDDALCPSGNGEWRTGTQWKARYWAT